MEEIDKRLRLVRFGMVAIVALAFGITSAYSLIANMGAVMPSFMSGLIAMAVTAVAMVAVYFGYAAFLKRGAE
jgi:hypothetical protein